MIEPVGQKVALEIISNLDRYAEDVKKRSGILISKATQGQPISGRVYAIAADIVDPEYKVGDVVIFKTPEGVPFLGHRMDGKELTFVEHENIIASVKE